MLLQPIALIFSDGTLKPLLYTLNLIMFSSNINTAIFSFSWNTILLHRDFHRQWCQWHKLNTFSFENNHFFLA